MTAHALALDYFPSCGSAGPETTGESNESKEVTEGFLRTLYGRPEDSGSVSGKYANSLEAIRFALKVASAPDWSEEGAKPLPPQIGPLATNVLTALPAWAPEPEITAEPSGELAFEWYVAPKKLMVLTVNARCAITWAGLFGEKDRSSGATTFTGTIPDEVQLGLRKLL